MIRFLLSALLALQITAIQAEPASYTWYHRTADKQVVLYVDLFLSTKCQFCQRADLFFRGLEAREPWLVVHRHMVNIDKAALRDFSEQLHHQGLSNFSVPAIFFCDARWTGFANAETSGQAIWQGLRYCYHNIQEQGSLTPDTIHVLRQMGYASQFQITHVDQSVWTIVPLSALMDAFNPCSLFCFMAFLAVLWWYSDDKKKQVRLGMVVIVSLGILHYFQQMNTRLYGELLDPIRLLAIVTGVFLLLLLAFDYRRIRQQIALRPKVSSVSVLILTLLIVQWYQQTCVLNLSLAFEQWLMGRNLSLLQQILSKIGYQIVYLLPLGIVLLLHAMFYNWLHAPSRRVFFKTAAGVVLTSIAVFLILYPFGLAKLSYSMLVVLAALVIGFVVNRRLSRV